VSTGRGTLAISLALMLLAGCASIPPRAPLAWDIHRDAMAAIDYWHLNGKMGYRGRGDSGSATLTWVQQGASLQATLSGPFGAGTAHIDADPDGAVLRQPGTPERRAASTEELSQQLFGWALPAARLRDWVRGIPYHGTPVQRLDVDASGLLRGLEQDGWTLAFDDYTETAAGLLPGRIEANGGDLHIRLVIKQWRFTAP
jgi:outer membrane lipoprotein LolB